MPPQGPARGRGPRPGWLLPLGQPPPPALKKQPALAPASGPAVGTHQRATRKLPKHGKHMHAYMLRCIALHYIPLHYAPILRFVPFVQFRFVPLHGMTLPHMSLYLFTHVADEGS